MKKGAILLALAVALQSCSPHPTPPATTPTPLPTQTATPIPSATPFPTSTPTARPSPTSTPRFLMPLPSGTPARKWNGITIMPGALAGAELDSTSYSFTTLARPGAIETYLSVQMAQIGWSHLATGTGDTGSLFIVFTRGAETASISVFPVNDDLGTNYVLILLH